MATVDKAVTLVRMPTMNVSLPSDLSEFVSEQLEHGGYNNQSEVIRDGLRLLRSRQEKLRRLRADIEAGVNDVDNGTTPLTEQRLADIESRARRQVASNRNRPGDPT